MPNNFLEEIKGLGYTQEQVLELLKKQADNSESETEIEEPSEEEAEQIEGSEAETEQSETPEKPKKPELDLKKMKEVISEEVKKQLKIKRKTPPKGEVTDEPYEPPTVKKNKFEVRV